MLYFSYDNSAENKGVENRKRAYAKVFGRKGELQSVYDCPLGERRMRTDRFVYCETCGRVPLYLRLPFG